MVLINRPTTSFSATRENISRSEINLALYGWVPNKARAVVFYIHGMQSHGNWLFETGPFLASQAIAVFVLDRRGSGLSGGVRGDLSDIDSLFTDYCAALTHIKKRFSQLPLTLLGQSLGGSILAGLLSSPFQEIALDNVIFCAPALGQMHAKLSEEERENIAINRSLEVVPVNLLDEDYTENQQYLQFIKQDILCLRNITRRSKAVLLEVENTYLTQPIKRPEVTGAFVYPKIDPIIRTAAALEIFTKMDFNRKLIMEFPGKEHYLEFSAQRNIFLNWLINFVHSNGYRS